VPPTATSPRPVSPLVDRPTDRPARRSRRGRAPLTAALAAVVACAVVPGSPGTASAAPGPGADPSSRAAVPSLQVSTRVSGLSHPWDVKPIGGGRLLITERDPARLTVAGDGGRRTVDFPTDKIWVSGETGLMGLEVDRDFADNGRFYTCSGWQLGGDRHDIRVNAWKMDDGATRATLVGPLVTGLPTSSGRHGGCRLLLSRSGQLLVGTGDAAIGTNPQNKASLGGKTLRLDPRTGRPSPQNPFARSDNRKKRYVLTYGHRNVQGLAQRADGSLWSVEQGSSRDDEVNRLVAGGNYGWNPVPGYDESVPMTDQSLPGPQQAARWRSGSSTLATSGADFVRGKGWGALSGTLAVAALKAERVIFLKFGAKGGLQKVTTPAALREYGRLRTVESLGGGSLLVLTDGADGSGRVLSVKPR